MCYSRYSGARVILSVYHPIFKNIFWNQPRSYLLSSSWRKFEEMIEHFRLHEGSKDSVQAEAMQREQPYKITDKELNTLEDKVKQLAST